MEVSICLWKKSDSNIYLIFFVMHLPHAVGRQEFENDTSIGKVLKHVVVILIF